MKASDHGLLMSFEMNKFIYFLIYLTNAFCTTIKQRIIDKEYQGRQPPTFFYVIYVVFPVVL